MTTMTIADLPLTQERLQFIGIGVNKLTLKSIYNIIQSSDTYNIVSSFICWNQNIVHIYIPRFRCGKEDLGLGGKRCILRE